MKEELLSISEEARMCRAAFSKIPIGALVLHCHHEILAEILQGSAENRINYILSDKPENEQALRLRLFRPVSMEKLAALAQKNSRIKKAYAEWEKARAELEKARAEWQKAHAEWQKDCRELVSLIHPLICKNCPWDGKTIFHEEEKP